MMDIWILTNAPLSDNYWLYEKLENKKGTLGIRSVYKLQTKNKASEYRRYGKLGWIMVQVLQIKLAITCIIRSKKDDIIITESYPTGRHCAILCTIFKQQRSILALNCLQRKKSKMVKFVDNVADYLTWRNPKFVTSVNVSSAIEKLTIPMNVKKNRHIYVIPDTYIDNVELFSNIPSNKKIYDGMTGGYANRDYSLFFEVAKENKNMKYACVVGSSFKKYAYEIPDNVVLYRDISEKQFAQIMSMSKCILLPLLDDSVAGLVVLKYAIANEQPFVISNTEAVCNYIPKEIRRYVTADIGNAEAFYKQFIRLHKISDNWNKQAKIIKNYAKKWSPENKISMIIDILYKEKFL